MKKIDSKNLYTERLDLRIPTIKEQHRIWEILCDEKVNHLYFPTPDRIFNKYNLKKDDIDDLKEARRIFMEQFKNWERQEPFYEKKIEEINNQENSQKYTWSIFLKDTDTVIGQITCQPAEDQPENIRDVGWFIDPAYHQKGYATEAAKRMMDFMFNEVEIDDIYTCAAAINPGSWKIMERLGFEYTGDKVSTYYIGDEILTSKCYHCNRETYLNNQKEKAK